MATYSSSRKYAGNGVFSRKRLSKIFAKKNARTDAECWELEHFVGNVMSGCGWDLKCWNDYARFCSKNTIPGTPVWVPSRPEEYKPDEGSPVWIRWFEQADPKNDKWPVIKGMDCRRSSMDPKNEPVWTWFQRGMRIADWVPITADCPVTKQLVPFKNGYYKAVAIEE